MTELRVEHITIESDGATLVRDASFALRRGELVALLGPNGAGKTTLLRAALGMQIPVSGTATLNGQITAEMPPMDRARQIAYLPQQRPLAWPNRVHDVVALGRFSHGAVLGRLQETDSHAVDDAIVACDIAHLRDRKTDTLSGGELARVHCARAFAAESQFLVVDEPVAALDPRHQYRVMDLIRNFVSKGGGALAVLHDVGLAAQYADRLIWIKDGVIVADGTPEQTLTSERLQDIYRIKAQVDGRSVRIEGAS